MTKTVDILIIGGGLTGAALLLALRGLGYSVCMVEARPFDEHLSPDFDARSLALSPASQRILSMLGVWDSLQAEACAIDHIHVSDQHRFGATRLRREKDNPLGYVLEMHAINRALYQLLPKDQILAPASVTAFDKASHTVQLTTKNDTLSVTAQCIVAADGADSLMRGFCESPVARKNYHQQAIVANIGLAKAHANQAFERFTAEGPLALLPMRENRMSLVWAMRPERAAEYMALPDSVFLKQLQQTFGYRLGRFNKAGKRVSYPLAQVLMPQPTQWPVVFVGNAAHTLHPVAGQGFNLGLRDVAALAQSIAQYGLNAAMFDKYFAMRQQDQQLITRCTDGLVSLFTSQLPGTGLARSLGFIALDNLPMLKKVVTQYASGFGGIIPDLVCDIALTARSDYAAER